MFVCKIETEGERERLGIYIYLVHVEVVEESSL